MTHKPSCAAWRRTMWIGALSTGMFHGCNAATTVTAVDRAVVDEIRDVDLGKVMEGEEPKHTFTIHNTTGKSFELTAIKKSCGCQTADVKEGTIIPAGGVLKATYALPRYGSGTRSGRLAIVTDAIDKAFQEIVLTLRADVQPKLWATPAQLQFRTIKEGEPAQQELRVESLAPELLDSFREVTTSRGLVIPVLEKKTPAALVFSVVLAPDAAVGEAYDLISLRFADPQNPQLSVRVRSRKGASIAVIPKFLRLSPFVDDETQTRRIRVMSTAHADGAFRIRKIECPARIAVSKYSAEPHHTFDLTLTFQGRTQEGPEEKITIHTEPPGIVTVGVRYASAADL